MRHRAFALAAVVMFASTAGAQQTQPPAPPAPPPPAPTITRPPVEIAAGTPYRFQITAVGDSTVGLALGGRTWVKRGDTGIIVDPTHGDVLIARFRLIAVDVKHGSARALITGQTTVVTDAFIAIIDRPPTPFYKRGSFWGGFVAGAVAGIFAGTWH